MFNKTIYTRVVCSSSKVLRPKYVSECFKQMWLTLAASVCSDTGRCANTVSAMLSTIGTTSSQRLNRSIQVRTYTNPSSDGKGPTRSMCTWSKSASGVEKVPGGDWLCLWSLDRWHCRQERAYWRTSALGQTKCRVTSHWDARTPGWDSAWTASKKGRLNSMGTSGRWVPVETLHSNLTTSVECHM